MEVRWSAEILAELRRVLETDVKLPNAKVERLVNVLERAFTGASVEGYGGLAEQLDLPDRTDHHVLAAALVGECDLLVTENTKDFPIEVLGGPVDLLVCTIDEAIVRLVEWLGPSLVDVVNRQLAALQNPSQSLNRFLESLEAVPAPLGAAALGALFDVEPYVELDRQRRWVTDPGSPQHAVQALLVALANRDDAGVARLVGGVLAERVAGAPLPTVALAERLRARLAPVLGGGDWGFPAALRPERPGEELVWVVRGDGKAAIYREPTAMAAVGFVVVHRGGAWLITDLRDDPSSAR